MECGDPPRRLNSHAELAARYLLFELLDVCSLFEQKAGDPRHHACFVAADDRERCSLSHGQRRTETGRRKKGETTWRPRCGCRLRARPRAAVRMRPPGFTVGLSRLARSSTRAFWQRPLITLTQSATFRIFGCFVRQRLEAENPMSYVSLNQLLATAKLATPEQFEEWRKAWQVSASNGSTESLLEFLCRESGN